MFYFYYKRLHDVEVHSLDAWGTENGARLSRRGNWPTLLAKLSETPLYAASRARAFHA